MSLRKLHPHPTHLPLLYDLPIIARKKTDSQWLKAAGYENIENFMSFYAFNNPKDFYKAQRLLRFFRNYPESQHPGFLSLCDGEPNLKSRTEWLMSAGYKGFWEFAEWYELENGPAMKLLLAFRDNHQMAWLEMHRKIEEKAQEHLKEWQDKVEKAAVSVGGGGGGAEEQVVKVTRAEIDMAVLWHEKQGHLDYQALKQLAIDGVLHEMPDFIKKMDVGDIPVCEHCKTCGVKDR